MHFLPLRAVQWLLKSVKESTCKSPSQSVLTLEIVRTWVQGVVAERSRAVFLSYAASCSMGVWFWAQMDPGWQFLSSYTQFFKDGVCTGSLWQMSKEKYKDKTDDIHSSPRCSFSASGKLSFRDIEVVSVVFWYLCNWFFFYAFV